MGEFIPRNCFSVRHLAEDFSVCQERSWAFCGRRELVLDAWYVGASSTFQREGEFEGGVPGIPGGGEVVALIRGCGGSSPRALPGMKIVLFPELMMGGGM